MEERETELLTLTDISKSFGLTKALVNVNLKILSGEIHGLIGENGSGKSTITTIIAGIQKADYGKMIYKGHSFTPMDALDANHQGICYLMQEQGTFGNITVAANIFAGKEHLFVKHGIMDVKGLNKRAKDALKRIGADHIDEKLQTGKLPFEDRKLVEIARAMENDPDILIVDETSTALSKQGRDILYDVIRKQKSHGKSVIFISHDIDEVSNMCDSLTVLRDGHLIATLDKSNFNDQKIRQLMVGREVAECFYRTDSKATSEKDIALKVEHITNDILSDISMTLRKGEIVGIGGLTDCGMHELGKICFGLIKPQAGHVFFSDGKEVSSSVKAVKGRLAYVSKDRDNEALMTNASIKDNICAPVLKRLGKWGYIPSKSELSYAEKWASEMSTKMENVNQAVMQLSGGNKQKISVAKWVGFGADVYIFDCPTRGIDIGVKSDIYQLLIELKKQGKAILMISEEIMEVIGMADRIIIIKDGRITGEFSRDEELTESKLIEYII